MKTRKKEFTVNYNKHWDKNGTCYTQGVNITKTTLSKLKDILQCEVVIKKNKTGFLSETFGHIENGVVFMNLSQRDLFNKFLKLPLKDRNTCFIII